MSAKPRNQFCPSVERLETRNSPGSLSGLSMAVRPPVHSAQTHQPAMEVISSETQKSAALSSGVSEALQHAMQRSWAFPHLPRVPRPPVVKDMNALVVQKARTLLDAHQKVGRGECTDLVEQALKNAGAKTTHDFGVSGSNKDYVWGKQVYFERHWSDGGIGGTDTQIVRSPKAGDIIQFRDVKIVSGRMTYTYSHHTAIISQALGNGKYKIIEQNWKGGQEAGRVPAEHELNLNGMQAGTIWVYQPVKK